MVNKWLAILILMAPLSVYAAVGGVWIEPSSEYINTDQKFTRDLHVDTGAERLGAYQFTITFDPALINVNTAQGTDGVAAGTDGFIAAVNVDNKSGSLVVNGFDVNGKGPGISLELLKIHFVALDKSGSGQINIEIESLTDENGNEIGVPVAKSTNIEIR